MSENILVQELSGRTHGGSGAAVVPGQLLSTGLLPDAPPPAGVQDVMDRLYRQITAPDANALPDWVFLVGGPGNGKSHQLACLLDRLAKAGVNMPKIDIGTAHRHCPRVEHNGESINIVNDATIRPPSTKPNGAGHLAADLKEADNTPKRAAHLLININRGVLIEERADAEGKSAWRPYAAILHWLVNAKSASCMPYVRGTTLDHHYYSTAVFCSDGHLPTARLHAVGLDVLSLLERTPAQDNVSVVGIGTEDVHCKDYKVMLLDSDDRWLAPMGTLLEKVVSPSNFEQGACQECKAAELCPILANAKSLRHAAGGKGFLATLRSAEIATGRLFTYRDFWSLLATVVIGPRQDTLDTGSPCVWVHERLKELEDSDPQLRRRSLVELQLHRCHQVLFPNRLPHPYFCGLQSWRIEPPPAVPAAENLLLVDPARDVAADWADQASVALEEWAFEASPILRLEQLNVRATAFFCKLDERFETELFSWLSSDKVKDKQRREHLRWLGTAYYRAFALATCRPGQKTIVSEWINVRVHVERRQAHVLTSDLHKGLDRLLFPGFPQVGLTASLLPLFAPRVDPVSCAQERNTLCMAVPREGQHAIILEYDTLGDSLWICLKASPSEGGHELARLQLDYFTCREAMVSARGNGFTEAGATSVPRIERFRASLTRATSRPFALVLVGNTAVPAQPTTIA